MPDDVQAVLDQAVQHHRSGDAAAAEPLYREVLRSHPGHTDTQYLLGTALLQLERFRDSIALLEAVVSERPDSPDAHNNLGVAHQALGEWELAAKAFEQAVRADPKYDQALYNLGALMEDRGLDADAEKCYRHALEHNPHDQALTLRLAAALKRQQLWPEAETLYRKATERQPEELDPLVELAFVLASQERLDEAAEIYQHVLDVQPDYYQVRNSLSYVYERQGRLEEAVETAKQVARNHPEFAEGHNNLGSALVSEHRLDEACESFARALEVNPNFALAAFNLGTTHLMAGRYNRGWSGYARHAESLGGNLRSFAQPCWQGEMLDGKTLLIYADQGFGDTIQFSRFIARAKQFSKAEIVLECPPELLNLLSQLPGADCVVAEGSPLPHFDRQVPLVALPQILQINEDTLCAGDAYLQHPDKLRSELEALLESRGDATLRVGLVWRGNPRQARDIHRSCPLEALKPLFQLRDVHWVSLQADPGAVAELEDVDAARRPTDVGSHLQDFSETAAVMKRLDLVVTVDTATAHLAGALGGDVWTLLCWTPDWRWQLERTDTPWYPKMRLYRQAKWGDWESAIAEISQGLQQLASNSRFS